MEVEQPIPIQSHNLSCQVLQQPGCKADFLGCARALAYIRHDIATPTAKCHTLTPSYLNKNMFGMGCALQQVVCWQGPSRVCMRDALVKYPLTAANCKGKGCVTDKGLL